MRKIAAAAIMKENKIMIAKRNYGSLAGFWEFPGGKVEGFETDTECLCREIKEELSVNIVVQEYLGKELFTVDASEYEMSLYKAKLVNETFKLHVHSEVAWVEKKELLKYNLAPVDIKLAIKCFGGD
ncbi:(deoxy)nucleoside triphosphate pyrophosphohydrolase [Blautia schinkii]|nr:(deoxy)nucleoside triphosphate pyrophosphohydrolase [Blautia schinkii]